MDDEWMMVEDSEWLLELCVLHSSVCVGGLLTWE